MNAQDKLTASYQGCKTSKQANSEGGTLNRTVNKQLTSKKKENKKIGKKKRLSGKQIDSAARVLPDDLVNNPATWFFITESSREIQT